MTIRNSLALFGAVLAVLLLTVDAGKDRNVPHGHTGILRPYQPGPFDISLQASDEKDLISGKPVMKQSIPSKGEKEAGGGAICIQDIEAPKEAVWSQILRLDEYPKKVPKVIECKNYDVHKNRDGSITMKTRQKLGILPGYSV